MSQVVLLTDTVLNGDIGNSRYMGAYAVASELRRRNISCTVIDYFTRRPDFFEYLEHFLSGETLALGVSSTFLAPPVANRPRAHRSKGLDLYYSGELFLDDGESLKNWTAQLKELLRRKSPDCKLILGGVKSQFALWRPHFYSDFDIITLGAADHSFANLMECLRRQDPLPLKTQNGITFLDNTFDLTNKSCPEALWLKCDAVQKGESLPLEISRGCVFNCKFCHYDKKESFKKDLDILKRELIRNYENFGVTTYSFCDDCFNDHPQKVEAYCKLFLDLPFTMEWVAYSRVDVAVKYPETVDLMVRSGARGLYWGLESFHEEAARRAGKGTPPDKVKSFLESFAKKYKGQCLSEGSFIVGLPYENESSLRSTLSWVLEKEALDFTTIGPLGLMPYVPNFDKIVFDYADYSRNPEKYGFKEVRFKPNYWRHDWMDSHRAEELATEMVAQVRSHKPTGFIKTMWLYPHAKTLGFSHEEIMQNITTPKSSADTLTEMSRRFRNFINNYHSDLLLSRGYDAEEGR